MGGFSSDDEDMIAGINVTPLVDIILVLLIIFMVTTSYIVHAQIEVNLPTAAKATDEIPSTLTLQVTADGQYILDTVEMSLQEIANAARAARAEDENVRAVIAADKDVQYEKVIDLIDAIKIAGIEKFALNIVRTDRAKVE